jgi:hypothetical protein
MVTDSPLRKPIRNFELTKAIINGMSFAEATRVYDITHSRVTEIFYKSLRMMRHPTRMPKDPPGGENCFELENLRANKALWLYIVDQMVGSLESKEKDLEYSRKTTDSVPNPDASIDVLHLTNRPRNALLQNDVSITTVGQLAKLTGEQLSDIPNLGRKSIREIFEKLEAYRSNTSR